MGGATLSGIAYAQEQEEAAPAQGLEEVTVTGSRIRRDDFSSAQPTTVMDNEYLQNLGIINLGQAMAGVPQNVNRNSPDANAGNNFFNGSTLANLRGLNPFFGTRTLTLVDSRRHVPTNQGDGVDLNFIPTILIDRVETVTGGASASYGSGAIGGVQNILLDRDFEGIKAELDFGASGEGDADSTHYGFAFGTTVGETGNFVVGVEGEDSDGILKCSSTRDWCGTNTGVITNWTQPPGADGLPRNLIIPGLQETWNSRLLAAGPGCSGGSPGVSLTDDACGRGELGEHRPWRQRQRRGQRPRRFRSRRRRRRLLPDHRGRRRGRRPLRRHRGSIACRSRHELCELYAGYR
jgi:outer membrane receptor protein involved in Fe transport